MEILGIDIGGSGVKGAPVDTEKGKLLADRFRVATPHPATFAPLTEAVSAVKEHFAWTGPVGCGFPAALPQGIARTAAHIADDWIGEDVSLHLGRGVGTELYVVNDADAAGLAEMRFGAGKGRHGVVLLVTVGSGLGTALFTDGHLVPNTELGHIEIRGKDAEARASDGARKRKDWSWKKWARKLDEYLCTLERLLWPDLIILGGGVSKKKKRKKYLPYLTVSTEVVPAQLRNEAGIVGAALAAELQMAGKW